MGPDADDWIGETNACGGKMPGWLWANAGIAIVAPLLGLGLVLFIHLLAHGSGGLPQKIVDRINVFGPFRDGQLGYVGVGWAVAAYHEMHEWQHGKASCDWVSYIDIGLFVFGFLAGLVAAFGAVSPMEPLAEGAAAPVRFSGPWWRRNLTAISSIMFSLAILLQMILVHIWAHGDTCNG